MATSVPTETDSRKAGRVIELDPARVKPFADQPRKRFRGIAQLAQSIKTVGQVTPILVTDCDDPDYDAELVDGERRLRACRYGKMKVRTIFDNAKGIDRHLQSMAANFCRQAHDAVEIMEAVLSLKKSGMSDAQIANAFGKTVTWVAQYASLNRLSPAVLEELKVAGDEQRQTRAHQRRGGRVTLSVALLLLRLPQQKQLSILHRIQAGKMSMAQARTFVHREAAGMGVRVGSRMSDYSKFKALRTAAENCACTVERYLEMPGVEINTIIRGASRNDKKQLSKLLENLCEQLLALSDALGKDR